MPPRLRPHLEPLEGRMLLSTVKAPTAPTPTYLNFVAAGSTTDYYVHAVASQQAGSVTLTLQRQDQGQEYQHNDDTIRVQVTTGPIPTPTSSTSVATAAGEVPPTWWGLAGVQSPNPGPSAQPGVQYQPVDETVTFPPGVTTEPVTIPIVAGAANPGMLSFEVTATQLGVKDRPDQQYGDQTTEEVFLTQNINAPVPRIVGAHMVLSGHRATDLILQFNLPMDQATIQNVQGYYLYNSTYHYHSDSGLSGLLGFGQSYSSPVGLKTATYNPSTNTVDFHLASPVDERDVYQIVNQDVPGTTLLDAAGTPINEDGTGLGGGFSITLTNKKATIFDGSNQSVIPAIPHH